MTNLHFLAPTLALMMWTQVMWLWMYLTRVPAMKKAHIAPDTGRHRPGDLDALPSAVKAVADNYNHLHEQPTVFYALMFFAALTDGVGPVTWALAWTYVGLRVVHSIMQVVVGRIVPRFLVFVALSGVLIALIGREALRLFLSM